MPTEITIPWSQLPLVLPEIWLTLAMCAVILVPFLSRRDASLPVLASLVGLLLALFSSWRLLGNLEGAGGVAAFSGMLAIDPFSTFFKVLLIFFTLLVVVQWLIVGRERTHVYDTPDFLCLILGATLGMSLMSSANNLVMIFLATEAASLPSFALAGFHKRTRRGSEASLKYVVFGAASSAIMLYGMSMVYGATGSLDLGVLAAAATGLEGVYGVAPGMSPMLAVGLLAMFAGIAFKLSAVPMHFWCPDVFQGAPIEVTTFLSVASKGAAVCMLVRVLSSFGMAAAGAGPQGTDLFLGVAVGIGILGAITATWGNLVAYHQNNIKRLLAYSSIAHAGYMIMAASLVAIAGRQLGGDTEVTARLLAGAILFYLLVYAFMNMGAFTVAAAIAQRTGSEDIRDYASLLKRSPLLAVLLSIFLLSLFGMPGLGGFMGKVFLATAMKGAGLGSMVLIAALLINTLLSLYYYIRPIYYMILVPDDADRPSFTPRSPVTALTGLCAVVIVLTGIFPGYANRLANDYGVLLNDTPRHAAGAMAPEAEPSSEAPLLEARHD